MADITRRDFLGRSASCGAHLAIMAAAMPRARRDWWAHTPRGQVVAQEPFGNLERVAENIWALISTPLNGDNTTLSNGGIIAGRTGVLAIEGFYRPRGAEWLAGKARELTGRWPTHVALTHYHADHANGTAGYLAGTDRPAIRATEVTRDQVFERNRPPDDARSAALREVEFLSPTEPTTLDLGGRTVRIVPRSGHTDSDISLEIDDPSVVFCGDLYWNAMFPNYVDAIPTQLSASVRALRRDRATVYVPGHGALGAGVDLDRYLAVLDLVEQGARRAHESGASAEDGGTAFTLPESLGEWMLFNPAYFARAFGAWYRELGW
ncbi:MAG TPA: MBL fold metallo-hydrolase [Gemmatimonadales bacterium]